MFATFRPACLREDFVADGIVDIQSNNGFSNGFCIHSNTHVSLNSNNTFEAGTVVSMPDLALLDLPRSGFETNSGLETALREGRTHSRVLNRIDEIYAGLFDPSSEYFPSYITDTHIYEPSGKTFTAADLLPGRMFYFSCHRNITFKNTDGPFQQIAVISECPIKFGANVQLQDARILSTAPYYDAFSSASGLQVGLDDNCATGGGVQLVTYGGMQFPADLQVFGSQLIALQDIEFAANANGIEGASMIAGGEIDGTSNMEMAFCGTGMEDNFEAEYFRLAH